jgi:hypothetical protein
VKDSPPSPPPPPEKTTVAHLAFWQFSS